jgi:hypothetical protein
MTTLWSIVSPYFWPVVSAYLFSGVYYVLRDISSKIDRPAYLSSPYSICVVCAFWFPMLILFFWRKWQRNSRHSYFKVLIKQLMPLLVVFFLLVVDFTYVRSLIY